MSEKIRVLVADDEALIRDGLRAIAELEGDIDGLPGCRPAKPKLL